MNANQRLIPGNFNSLTQAQKYKYYLATINMAIEPKNTREHILSLYGHISGVKKNLKHVHEDVEKLGGKIDQIYWVLLTAAGTAVVFVLERMFK